MRKTLFCLMISANLLFVHNLIAAAPEPTIQTLGDITTIAPLDRWSRPLYIARESPSGQKVAFGFYLDKNIYIFNKANPGQKETFAFPADKAIADFSFSAEDKLMVAYDVAGENPKLLVEQFSFANPQAHNLVELAQIPLPEGNRLPAGEARIFFSPNAQRIYQADGNVYAFDSEHATWHNESRVSAWPHLWLSPKELLLSSSVENGPYCLKLYKAPATLQQISCGENKTFDPFCGSPTHFLALKRSWDDDAQVLIIGERAAENSNFQIREFPLPFDHLGERNNEFNTVHITCDSEMNSAYISYGMTYSDVYNWKINLTNGEALLLRQTPRLEPAMRVAMTLGDGLIWAQNAFFGRAIDNKLWFEQNNAALASLSEETDVIYSLDLRRRENSFILATVPLQNNHQALWVEKLANPANVNRAVGNQAPQVPETFVVKLASLPSQPSPVNQAAQNNPAEQQQGANSIFSSSPSGNPIGQNSSTLFGGGGCQLVLP